MADYRMKIIDDGKRVIVKKQQVENIHGVPWRISLSKTVNNTQRQIKKAMVKLDSEKGEYDDKTLDELKVLYPTQFEQYVKNMDKKAKTNRSYRFETLLPRYKQFMRNEGNKVEQVILDETNSLKRHVRLMNWGNRDVRTLSASELDKLFLSFFIEKPNRAEGTWKKDISRWQYFFDWLVKINYLEVNTLRQYTWTTPEPLKNKNRKRPEPKRVYTKFMLDELYWYLDSRPMNYKYKRIMQLMIDTGLRIGEGLALTLEDIKNVAYYGDVIDRYSNAYGRLDDAFAISLRKLHRGAKQDQVYMLNKELFVNNFDDAKYYHELVVENVHELDYENGDLLFFADITDDIQSYLRVLKTVIKLPNPGKTAHIIQDHTKTQKGNRTVTLNRRARRTLTLLYRELIADPGFVKLEKVWEELGRKYLFIEPSGDFIVPNNVSENLKYITKKYSEINENFFPITAHDLRHAYSTYRVYLAKDYGEINQLSKELGHKNLFVTLDTYTHNESANLLYEAPDL